MATATTNVPAQITSDAQFRTLGNWVSTNFTDFGWVDMADTGSINWTTVTKPAGANTAAGFEVFRMADTMQATYPIFIKVEYGTSSGATAFALWLTIGKGTDGAGTLSNVIWTRRQIGMNSNSATSYDSYASGTTGRYQLALFPVSTALAALCLILSIERTVDANGTATGDGVFVICNNGTASAVALGCCYGAYDTGDCGYETQIGALLPRVGTFANGSDIGIAPIYYNATGGPFKNPSIGAVVTFTSNVSFNTSYDVVMYGQTMRFLACGDANANTGPTNWVRGTTANEVGLDIRYE